MNACVVSLDHFQGRPQLVAGEEGPERHCWPDTVPRTPGMAHGVPSHGKGQERARSGAPFNQANNGSLSCMQ